MGESDEFLEALERLDGIADEITVDEALDRFDTTTRQVFWKKWPHISGWAGGLWRKINEEVEAPARPVGDPDLDEVGEGG